jgi:hypothetical protein
VVGDHVLTQGKDTITTEPTKTLAVVSSKCSGGIFSEHWIDGQRCGPLQGAIAEKAVPFSRVARRSQFFLGQPRFTGVRSHRAFVRSPVMARPQLAGPRRARRLARLAALG